jgi:anti-sigma factor (TIGR02949 family)
MNRHDKEGAKERDELRGKANTGHAGDGPSGGKPSAPEDMGCLEAIDALYSYLDGELEDDWSADQVEFHISHCQSCYSRAEMEKILTDRMREAGLKARSGGTPEALQERLKNLMGDL